MVREGDTWGRIKCIGLGKIWVVDDQSEYEGVPEGVVDRTPHLTYKLQCECGNVIEVHRKGFLKREHRDCGCGIGQQDGKLIQMCMALPQGTIDLIREWAAKNTKGNRSRAVVMLLRAGKEEFEKKVKHAD